MQHLSVAERSDDFDMKSFCLNQTNFLFIYYSLLLVQPDIYKSNIIDIIHPVARSCLFRVRLHCALPTRTADDLMTCRRVTTIGSQCDEARIRSHICNVPFISSFYILKSTQKPFHLQNSLKNPHLPLSNLYSDIAVAPSAAPIHWRPLKQRFLGGSPSSN